jgi:hypothetical protein
MRGALQASAARLPVIAGVRWSRLSLLVGRARLGRSDEQIELIARLAEERRRARRTGGYGPDRVREWRPR